MEEENLTPTPTTEPTPTPDPTPAQEEPTLPQSKVDQIVQKRVAETKAKAFAEGQKAAIAELREKYGLDESDELDELLGDGQRYGTLSGDYESAKGDIESLKVENALLRANVPVERWDDVKAVAAYKGTPVTAETIEEMMQSHPEWRPAAPAPAPIPNSTQTLPQTLPQPQTPPPAIVSKLGGEPSAAKEDDDGGRAQAMRMFGL